MWKILKPMNDKREYYNPVIAYSLLLLLVWLLSWVVDMVAMFSGWEITINSLVSSEGVRWAARNAMLALDSVPWGIFMLLLAMVALLSGSGVVRMLGHLFKSFSLTKNERRSALFAFLALLLYAVLVYLATLSPFNILLGVTGHFASSPLMHGIPLLTFIAVLIVSLIYGFMYGNYRSLLDVVSSMGETYSFYMPALIALIPASGIMPCVEYTGVLELTGCAGCSMHVVTGIVYLIPFLYVVMLRLIVNGRKNV